MKGVYLHIRCADGFVIAIPSRVAIAASILLVFDTDANGFTTTVADAKTVLEVCAGSFIVIRGDSINSVN